MPKDVGIGASQEACGRWVGAAAVGRHTCPAGLAAEVHRGGAVAAASDAAARAALGGFVGWAGVRMALAVASVGRPGVEVQAWWRRGDPGKVGDRVVRNAGRAVAWWVR